MKKSARRILRSSHELKELIGSIHRMNGETIRVGLHPKAWNELGDALKKDVNLTDLKEGGKVDGNKIDGREAVLRNFLNSDWVRRWHEIDKRDGNGRDIIPSMVSNGQSVIVSTTTTNNESNQNK